MSLKVIGRVGFPPFECKGQAAADFYGQDVVEIEPSDTPVTPCEWFKPHCADCRILGEHSRANPHQTCWCQHCAVGAMHQADLRQERELNP
jgi:hypothetical protein